MIVFLENQSINEFAMPARFLPFPSLPFIGIGRGRGGGMFPYRNTENNSIQWNETAATGRGRREQPASNITEITVT